MALAAVALCLAACKSVPSGNAPKDRIVELNLITVPVAIDLDGRAGVDGIALKLYASNGRDPKAIRVSEGKVDFVLFDGTFHGRTNPPPILQTVTFTAAELRLNELKSNIGYGYEISIRWGTNLPTQRIMSVGARYTAPDGRSIVSRTSSVTVLSK